MPEIPTIRLAPLQGYTDKAYRKAFNGCFGNIDYYYSPYLSVDNDMSINNLKDILYEENEIAWSKLLVPQLLPGSIIELKLLLDVIVDHGFSQLNLNLGCPYPMVTRKGRGSALIQNPTLVTEMIEFIVDTTAIKPSLKIRAGLEEPTEIMTFLDNIPLNKLDCVIIHPRTAKQLYKGKADVNVFKNCIERFSNVNFIYNGDIVSYSGWLDKNEVLGEQSDVMIGRGIIKNPFLVWQIKNGSNNMPNNYLDQLMEFCSLLMHEIQQDSNDAGHALNRIQNQLSYLFEGFIDLKQLRKKIRKCNKIEQIKFELSRI